MKTELFYLTWVTVLTGLLWVPYVLDRAAVWGLTDTVGYHGDQNQRIFPYRDYVINAFNANKPFDRFTIVLSEPSMSPTQGAQTPDCVTGRQANRPRPGESSRGGVLRKA